jgi:hypothetical protein
MAIHSNLTVLVFLACTITQLTNALSINSTELTNIAKFFEFENATIAELATEECLQEVDLYDLCNF